MVRRFTLFLSALLFAAPFAISGAQARDFRFEDYFVGRTTAVGSFSAINGVERSFKVNLTGKWNGRTLTLREDFVYNDGERDTKTWRFTKTGKNTYSGTREDVVGETRVWIEGDTATFSYDVYLDPKNKANLVRFHDTMKLNPDGTVLNTARVTKFFFPVAHTTVKFRRG